MSLSTLKERLQKISKKNSEDTFTFDITEHKRWLKGHDPEDWLEYIQHIKDNTDFPNTLTRHNVLSDVFEQAFKDLNAGNHKSKESYAELFVSYARLKSDTVPDDAHMLFNQARAIVRKFAIVHIASAQFEIERDNPDKAQKILEKAILFDAKPVEAVKEALQKLKKGELSIYSSPTHKRLNDSDSSRRKFPSGSDTSSELSMKMSPPESLSTSISVSIPQKTQAERLPEPIMRLPSSNMKSTASKMMDMATVSNTTDRIAAAPTHPDSSLHRRGLKCFRSTPLLNSEKKNVGLPGRVKRINLPFEKMQVGEEEEEADMNTMDSFKPLEKDYNASTGFGGHHTSGYHSMIQGDTTIPMEKKHEPPVAEHKCEMKEEPQMIKPVLPVSEPVVRNPVPEPVPCTPINKVIPSTPMQSMKMLVVNDEQYGVLGVTGSGGSSKVYQVFDGNHKIKAIKVVNLDNANDIIVEGYKNEIKLLKRLQYCDQVIKLYDSEFKSDENKLYVVMECGSEDLASFFRSRTKDRRHLSHNLIRFYWEIMLEAVQALHKEGIIHSDLKPANFLLVGGNLKLIDFGIAKAIQQDKTSVILETQIGTLNYMSPETIMDSCGDMPGGEHGEKRKYKIGVKSDVWSLGCILYNMVYRRTPFQHLKHDLFKLQAIINPNSPIEFPDIGNPHLVDVMQQCLNRDPKMRPSIDELLKHPYLRAEKESKEESPAPGKVYLNKKMDALVSSLASQYALSPNGIRSLIEQTMSTEQTSPDAVPKNTRPAPTTMASIPPVAKVMKPHSLVQRPEGPVMRKQIRTPLGCLSLQHLQTATSDHDPNIAQRKPSGS